MTRLFAGLVLSMILIQSFLLPATVKAIVDHECPVVTATMLPATNITDTSATLHGTACITYDSTEALQQNAGQEEGTGPLIVEWGTAPGLYTNKYSTTFGSTTSDARIVRKSVQNQGLGVCTTIDFTVEDLTPCTTYYFRLHVMILGGFLGNENLSGAQGAGIGLDGVQLPKVLLATTTPIECPTDYYSNEISFKTTGCITYIGTGPTSHQSGGFNGITTTTTTNLSNIVVQSATITSTKVSPGEKVDVTASVTNKGGSNGTSKVTLYINGQEADSKGITLTSGESTQVHFSVSQNDPGTYSVYVNGVPAGNITVDLFTNNDALIVSIIALFAVGIVGVLYLVVRRRSA